VGEMEIEFGRLDCRIKTAMKTWYHHLTPLY
jgi:hypothetical protein